MIGTQTDRQTDRQAEGLGKKHNTLFQRYDQIPYNILSDCTIQIVNGRILSAGRQYDKTHEGTVPHRTLGF